MASIPTTSKLSASTSSGTDEKNKIDYETDLQHMMEFNQKYQHVFGEGASIRTIMKRRISHMNPPMPKAVCEEEMQNAQLDNNEVVHRIYHRLSR